MHLPKFTFLVTLGCPVSIICNPRCNGRVASTEGMLIRRDGSLLTGSERKLTEYISTPLNPLAEIWRISYP